MQSVGNRSTEAALFNDRRVVAQRQLTVSIVAFALIVACGLIVTLGHHRSDAQDQVAAQPQIVKTTARVVPSSRPQASDPSKADRRS